MLESEDPLVPSGLKPRGIKRIVEEEEIGLHDLQSFPNLADSATLMTKSEILHEEDKHDLVDLEAMTMSMTEFILWTSLPRAQMSPGRDLSMRR